MSVTIAFSSPTRIFNKEDLGIIIRKQRILDELNAINQNIAADKYDRIRITFSYDDIKYIIVPSRKEKDQIITHISAMPDILFENNSVQNAKMILASKVLDLEEIKLDW